MASVGDVFRIRGCQTLLGESLCNVFYYVVSLWTGNSSVTGVATKFKEQVIDVLAAVQATDLIWKEVVVDNLNDPDEFTEVPIAVPGLSDVSVMPAYVAAGVRLVRTTKQTRHGAKRIAGVGDDQWTDGVFLPTIGFVNAVEAGCEASLLKDDFAGNAFTLDPVIVGTDPITGQPDPDRINLVGVATLVRDTTQNSRKGYTA